MNTISSVRDICTEGRDLAYARDWMTAICGRHELSSRGPGQVCFTHRGTVLRSTAMTLGLMSHGAEVSVSVEEDEGLDCYSLSLPLDGEQQVNAGGCTLGSDRSRGVILSPYGAQQLDIAANCLQLHVAIPRQAMEQGLEHLLQRPMQEPLRFEPSIDAVQGASGSWWRMVEHLVQDLRTSIALYDQAGFTRDLEHALIKGLLLAQPNNYSARLRQSEERSLPQYLVRAREFIHAHARDELDLDAIEAASGVSRSKLFECFGRYLGVPPMIYLKRYRLNGVRQQLLEDGCPRNISAIAMAWGFAHLGRFAGDYRKLFGETPSATLQRQAVRRASH